MNDRYKKINYPSDRIDAQVGDIVGSDAFGLPYVVIDVEGAAVHLQPAEPDDQRNYAKRLGAGSAEYHRIAKLFGGR